MEMTCLSDGVLGSDPSGDLYTVPEESPAVDLDSIDGLGTIIDGVGGDLPDLEDEKGGDDDTPEEGRGPCRGKGRCKTNKEVPRKCVR